MPSTIIYELICRNCGRGHISTKIPVRPDSEQGETPCPFCEHLNPGWEVWESRATPVMNIMSRAEAVALDNSLRGRRTL